MTTSAFNRLGQYSSSSGTGQLLRKTDRFFTIEVAKTTVSTYCAYATQGGMAKLRKIKQKLNWNEKI